MPPVHLVAFDIAAYAASDFDRHGVNMPASLARAVPKRHAEFLAGRLAARAALASIGVSAWDIVIGSFRQPIWPEGTIGSISHTGNLAAAAATSATGASGIGIDVESVNFEHAQAIATAGVLDASETALLADLHEEFECSAAVTLMFSAKESFFKAVFGAVGTYFGFDAVKVVAVRPGDGSLALELRTDLSAGLVSGQRFEVAFTQLQPETVLTVCLW